MEYIWKIKSEAEPKTIEQLSESLNGISPVLSNILIQRGIDDFDKSKAFFRPDLNQMHDPMLMKNMDKAILRIATAIKNDEKILIYGDYDVDGTTSVALVYSFLSNYSRKLDFYIPDRYKEGYGISNTGIDYAKQKDISLIIALDCGIKAIDQIDYANQFGIDFIICDHHLPGEEIPKALAVLDPKQKDCTYPFKELSGCGVGFKLMQALCDQLGYSEEILLDKLDLLAVSICADIVPMNGENRIFTHYGLKKINTNPQMGIKSILNVAQMKKRELSVTDVVFTIAPRINAAGRIEDANNAVRLLLSEDTAHAKRSGEYIDQQNRERKEIDQKITQEALGMIESDTDFIQAKSTVLFDPNWHKGVIGIVASRCIEHYYRPTIIFTKSEGKISGSARSVKGFNIHNALDACRDLIEQFGGHKYAAGLTIEEKNLDAFRQRFEKVVSETIQKDSLQPILFIDSEIKLSQIDKKFYQVLKQFAPFGPENMKPIFIAKNVITKDQPRIVGKDHLKLDLIDPESKANFPAIAFGLANRKGLVEIGNPIDVVFSIEENEWNNRKTIQLNVKDIKESA